MFTIVILLVGFTVILLLACIFAYCLGYATKSQEIIDGLRRNGWIIKKPSENIEDLM